MGRKEGVNKAMYLSRSSEYIMNAIEEIRKLTKGMITSVIKDVGLCEAIDSMIKDTMEIYPVKIICKDDLIEEKLHDKFKLNVFRIMQEQLNNILKHAKATVVTIVLSQNKKNILVSMEDNGVGFDTTKPIKGIGIKNIKNRAEVYGGAANFVSQPGKGCVLTITFPVKKAQLPLP
jgi:signal transduction histidine kinase